MKDEYTAESWKVYANAMEGLKAALADENISKEDLQAAVDAVEKAVKGLEKVGTPTPEPTPDKKPGQKPQQKPEQKPAKTGDNMSTGAIVGIVVVAVLAIGVIVGVIINKKRKK